MRREALVLGAAMLLCAGCSSAGRVSADSPTSAATTVAATTLPAVTTTSGTGINPDVIPSVITVPYVNAVFRVLNHINGNAARLLIDSGTLSSTVEADLKSIYGPLLLPVELRVFSAGLKQDTSNLRHPMGDRVTLVRRLLTSSASCIFVESVTDLSAVELHPTAQASSEYWELTLKRNAQDPGKINPTPWVAAYNVDYLVPTNIKSPCP